MDDSMHDSSSTDPANDDSSSSSSPPTPSTPPPLPQRTPSSPTYRILEVQLVSAQGLKHVGNKARAYAKVWIHPHHKLSTRAIDASRVAGPAWGERFVFAAEESFLRDPASAVAVEVYCTCRVPLFPDRRLGRVDCPLAGIVGRNAGNGHVDKPSDAKRRADSSALVRVYVMEAGCEVKVGMDVWEGNVKCLGFSMGMDLAMDYSELMMQGSNVSMKKKKKKKGHKFLQCFIPR